MQQYHDLHALYCSVAGGQLCVSSRPVRARYTRREKTQRGKSDRRPCLHVIKLGISRDRRAGMAYNSASRIHTHLDPDVKKNEDKF